MALSVIGGKKINSHSGGTGPKILKNSEKLSNQEIVVRPQSNNLFHHADVILCGLNVSLSSEKKEFSLFSEKIQITPARVRMLNQNLLMGRTNFMVLSQKSHPPIRMVDRNFIILMTN